MAHAVPSGALVSMAESAGRVESLKRDANSEAQMTLSGELERRLDAELLPRFTARVPGVVTVDSSLTWRLDDRRPP